MNGFKQWTLIFLVSIFASGCATQLKLNKEVGQLNLDYDKSEQEKKSSRVIGVVSPALVAQEYQSSNNASAGNPWASLMAANSQQYQANFISKYQQSYANELSRTMNSEFWAMINRKGFKTKGPFESYNDINYRDKKSLYLVAVPKLELTINQKANSVNCKRLFCSDSGAFQIGGELLVKMVEPLTEQTLLTKRINLSSFNISKQYLYQVQHTPGGNDLVGTALDKLTAPDVITDNTDKVLTEALNEFYRKAMTKIDVFLSSEELLSFSGEVDSLKTLKRY